MTKSSADKYSDPQLRDQIKEEVQAGSKGGKPGQWSARKAQMLASEYKARGGTYRGPKDDRAKNLDQWTAENWQIKDGDAEANDNSQSDGINHRYSPRKAWEKMNEEEKEATDAAKVEGCRRGKQLVPNTEIANDAGKESQEEVKGDMSEEERVEHSRNEDSDGQEMTLESAEQGGKDKATRKEVVKTKPKSERQSNNPEQENGSSLPRQEEEGDEREEVEGNGTQLDEALGDMDESRGEEELEDDGSGEFRLSSDEELQEVVVVEEGTVEDEEGLSYSKMEAQLKSEEADAAEESDEGPVGMGTREARIGTGYTRELGAGEGNSQGTLVSKGESGEEMGKKMSQKRIEGRQSKPGVGGKHAGNKRKLEVGKAKDSSEAPECKPEDELSGTEMQKLKKQKIAA